MFLFLCGWYCRTRFLVGGRIVSWKLRGCCGRAICFCIDAYVLVLPSAAQHVVYGWWRLMFKVLPPHFPICALVAWRVASVVRIFAEKLIEV